MNGVMECVPNVSEGRNLAHIAACARAITSVPAVRLLDTHVDPDHHRSVFTAIGPSNALGEAVVRLASVTTRLIDLRRHEGEHPRMGALDVVPFVPVGETTMQQCAVVAAHVAARLADSLDLPVFLYGEAAMHAHRRELPRIRGKGFEALRARGFSDPNRRPDFGPHALHSSAGATAVGARDYLVAFNILLATADVTVAHQIAREIRTSSGGLPGVRALGFRVRGLAQVSMNLVDPRATPPRAAFNAVEAAARRVGVEVVDSEIVGLIPAFATEPADGAYLRLSKPLEDQILDHRIAAEFA